MDVFKLQSQLITDYSSYIRSFINIADERIGEHVVKELVDGALWPDPLLQLNPNFEPGATIDELVDSSQLHPLCKEIFRIDKSADEPIGKPLHLHRHQTDALEAAASGDNYVLTTGTGSGKSLAYIIPIVDFVLSNGSGKGVRAIVVYPMNALANSQLLELEKFLCFGFPDGKPPVTFRRYTGQESDEDKQEIIANPPDILLTNYVMLELVMTRPHEKKLIHSAKGLQFLVLDELHTYRGRQGADVAMLARRVRDYCESLDMQIVGTSATLAEGGPFAAQQEKIAKVATKLFGAAVKPERIIGETLQRATEERSLSDPSFIQELAARLRTPKEARPESYEALLQDPLSSWLETTFGLESEPESGRLQRTTPISITGDTGAAAQLSQLVGVPVERCSEAIQSGFLAAYDDAVLHPQTGFPVFAFRLHQFISRGDTVYASLEDPDNRYITLNGQQFVPGDRGKVLLPLVFCRECGQEYYIVTQTVDRNSGLGTFTPRELRDQTGRADEERGFLFRNPDNPWPEDEQILEVIPEDWLETSTKGLVVKRSQRKKLPRTVRVNKQGKEDEDGAAYQFVVTPFPFCLNCGVTYGGRERSDFAKLASLSSEGRSTATTVLSLSAYRALHRDETLDRKARKLLSFTDNRQDASLQAGHFNDFVEIGLLRAAVYHAVEDAGKDGLEHDDLPQRVFKALELDIEFYATAPDVKFKQRQDTERALREVLAYRMYQDLKRGWRVTSPNLEQCGLLRIEYDSLDELCRAEEEWRESHPALSTASPAERRTVAKALLDLLRRELAIKVDYLDANYQERIQQRSSQRLVEPWSIDEDEVMTHASIAFPRASRRGEFRGHTFVSPRSGFGIYLRRQGTFPNYTEKQRLGDTQIIIQQLFEVLSVAGLVEVVHEAKDEQDLPGYQMPADAMIWYAGDGTKPFYDPVRMPRQSRTGGRINPFFTTLYREVAGHLKRVYAREHTAQVPMDERLKREDLFRKAKLPVLYCSPTMELGVDISLLNVVNMRNVPPTPANYAQRSGRAGRSGQPALVFTYCTTGSPHDQYFFKRPRRMVSGSVAPPRLDLANEDLILAHVHAVWLAETGQSLGTSLKDILDLGGAPASLQLLQSVGDSIESKSARKHAAIRLSRIFQSVESELEQASWYGEEWLQKALVRVAERFDEACGRWRNLYWAAQQQQATQHAVVRDASRSAADKNLAARLRAEAEAQLRLLTDNSNVIYSDFY
ncbi:MAG: DEAD/DEAH box helicase, partial [Candidatus Promineifilaceae bacterium]